jgi:hypothetical protein
MSWPVPPAPATQPPWLQRARDEPLWAATLLGAVALCGYAIAAPLLAARYPMLVDLPMHAANASVFRHHHDPAWHFAEQFELRPFAVPYLSFYALAALFMLVLPPLAAVKLAVGVMLALLPAGLALLCWGMRKSPLLGLPALGLLWSNNTHWGFINFVAAMGLFAMVLGLALRLLDRPSRRTAVALGVCLLLLLFSHPFRFPFAVGGVAWATATCYQATRRWRPVVAPCLPALALFALWWWRYPPRDVGSVWSAFAVHGERMAEAPGYLFRNLRGPAEGIAAEDAGLGLLAVFAVLTGFAVPRVRAAWRKWRAEGSGDWLWRAGATAAVMGSTVAVLLGYLSLPMEIGWWWYVYPREIACALFIALALLPDLPPDQRAAPPLFLALCVALVVPQVRAVQSAFTVFGSTITGRRRCARRSCTCQATSRPSAAAGSAFSSPISATRRWLTARATPPAWWCRRLCRGAGSGHRNAIAIGNTATSSTGFWCARPAAPLGFSAESPRSSWSPTRAVGGSTAAAEPPRSVSVTVSQKRSELERAPQIPAGHRSKGHPALPPITQLGLAAGFVAVAQPGPGFAERVVAARQHVGAAELKDQQHLHAPRPHAPHAGERIDDGLVGHVAQLGHAGNLASGIALRQVAQRGGLGSRQAGGAQLVVAGGTQGAALESLAAELFEQPPMDGRRRAAGQLLVDDRPAQRVERGGVLLQSQREGANPANQFCHAGVALQPAQRGIGVELRFAARRCSGSPPSHGQRSSSTPSIARSRALVDRPPWAEKPPALPPPASTRWQGTTIGNGLLAIARPTARAAPGVPMLRASSP